MFNFFSKKTSSYQNPIKADIHSHLLPNLDDGVKSFDESLAILKTFEELGYEKIVTTPHIMKEFYDNNRDNIAEQYEILCQHIDRSGINISLEFAAEYYLDEFFLEKLNKKEQLLTFGNNYVLVETSFYNAPVFLKDIFFQMSTLGYKPIFAHPERYIYLHQNDALLDELSEMQVLFQINLNSLNGYYGGPVKKLAEKMIGKGFVDFVGSDCHNLNHLQTIQKTLKSKLYQSLPFEKLLNNSLLSV